MLRDEQALRDGLDTLTRRARAMRQHADHDSKIKALVERNTKATEALKVASSALRTTVARAIIAGDESSASAMHICSEAKTHLATVEDLERQIGEGAEEIARLAVARADLGVVPVDRQKMAGFIDAIAEHLDTVKAGIKKDRALLQTVCKEA
jgi:hypothetical protein